MMTFTNINEHFGDRVSFDSLEEMEQAILDSGYELPADGLVEGRDYEISTEKMLMEPHSGAVAPEGEWIEDYNHMSAEEWGGEAFEDAGLVEVVKDENGNWVEA